MPIFDDITVQAFKDTVWEHYRSNGRDSLPWRQPESDGSFDPYKIMLSEIMLQQTQVQRVIPKYHEFLQQFPSVQHLAVAELGEVLKAWSGLGYNRRAKFLYQAAQAIDARGLFPDNLAELVALPGIGANTAGAILAYAFNTPQPFLETNVRTVLIYHFFANDDKVSEKELFTLADKTLDREHPREWHWALMDYGSYLKQTVGNVSRQSKTYSKQSKFAGSNRQVRGLIIKALANGPLHVDEVAKAVPDERLSIVLSTLVAEGLVIHDGQSYRL